MESARGVSIVMLTYNNLAYTQDCLVAIERTTEQFQVVVVDNASTDGTVDYLKALRKEKPWLKVIFNRENRGFAAGCNQGVAAARYQLVCLLNNDTVPLPGWLDALRGALVPGVGAVGAKLLYPDGTIQHCGIEWQYVQDGQPRFWPYHRFMGLPSEIEEANSPEDVPGVTGACLLCTRKIWGRVGGMDEGYIVANFEDVDFNLKLRDAGWRVVYEPRASLIHYHGTTVRLDKGPGSAGEHFSRNYNRLMSKWFDKLATGALR